MIILILLIGLFLIFCLVGVVLGIVQYIKSPKPPKNLTMTEYREYYDNRQWECDIEEEEENELESVHKAERIALLDETIVKYNKLVDSLQDQYNATTDEKKRAAILSKQIITLEKLNKALERMEKLDK